MGLERKKTQVVGQFDLCRALRGAKLGAEEWPRRQKVTSGAKADNHPLPPYGVVSRTLYPGSPLPQRRSLKETCGVAVIRLLGLHLWGKLYILLSSFRCFLGHLYTQLSKDRVSVSLGPAMEWHCQSYRPNRRTLARRQGIEKLQATHPWADFQTLEIFLAGFDAGEQWGSGICDSHSKPAL